MTDFKAVLSAEHLQIVAATQMLNPSKSIFDIARAIVAGTVRNILKTFVQQQGIENLIRCSADFAKRSGKTWFYCTFTANRWREELFQKEASLDFCLVPNIWSYEKSSDLLQQLIDLNPNEEIAVLIEILYPDKEETAVSMAITIGKDLSDLDSARLLQNLKTKVHIGLDKIAHVIPATKKVCVECGTGGLQSKKLLKCGHCLSARYCSRQCQKANWRQVHKTLCPFMSQLSHALSAK